LKKKTQIFSSLLNDYDKFFTISLMDQRGTEYGSIKLNIVHFEDQKKRKEWIYLSDNTRGGIVVRLQLSIVLLKANVKIFKGVFSSHSLIIFKMILTIWT